MKILLEIDDFLLELFPNYKNSENNLEILKDELIQYYSVGPYKPTVTIKEGWAIIEIDTSTIINQQSDFRRVVTLCEKTNYTEAKKLLIPLISQNPTNSEYHRILGQVLSEEGEQEEAINSLIDALKWNPKNGFALLMMGNIFAKYQNDIDTAIKYYNQALKINPNDILAINNIGANLLQLGKTKEGIEYLERGYELNPKYTNTTYGLAKAYQKIDDLPKAFFYSLECLKNSNIDRGGVNISALTLQIASEICSLDDGINIFNQFKHQLEIKTGKEIRVKKDETIATAAKIEFAENYSREYHLIKYKPNYPAIVHLIMHELVHLEFATQARNEKANMLFIAGKEKKVRFNNDHNKDFEKLVKEGFNEDNITNLILSLYEGINSQIFNTPVDLFIEDYLFENFPELRPYQFISLTRLITEGKDAVTNKTVIQLTPKNILCSSKVLNLVNAIQIKDLYGVDLMKQFNALPPEIKAAERMWNEFLEYRTDRKPAEEYELIQHWGEDLKLDHYFELVDEIDYRNNPQTIEDVLKSIEADPFGTEVDKNAKERKMQVFLEREEAIGTNHAVIWFIVEALQYFENMPQEKIKAIAYEIAMIGTQGINPASGNQYKVPSIPNKEFSGYHLLAYFYTTWKLAIPDKVEKLGLRYEKEYEIAVEMNQQ